MSIWIGRSNWSLPHGVLERHTPDGLDDDTFDEYDAVKERYWDEIEQYRD